MKNNLYVAPHLNLDGSGRTAAIQVSGVGDLSTFTEISGNVWPDLEATSKQSGLNFVGSDLTTRTGYKDADDWENYAQVKNDAYRNVTLNGGYVVKVGTTTAGSTLKAA